MLGDLAHHQTPPAKVLALGPRTEGTGWRPWADDQIGVDPGPFGLLIKSADMVNFRIKSKAKKSYQPILPADHSSAA